MRTDRLQREHGVRFKWTVFPLHPDTPEEGMELSDLFPGRGPDLAAMRERLSAVAAQEGLPLSFRSRTYNSRKAQELGKLAERVGVIDRYQQEVYRAYFVEGRNIALPDELLEIGKRAGLPEQEARGALTDGSFAKDVDYDWNRAGLLGITGVPAFVCGNRLLVGFRPYQELVSLISTRLGY